MLKLLFHELRVRRGAILGWSIGIAIFGAYVVILYPDFAEPLSAFNFEDIAIYEALGDFGDMGSFSGFISAEVFTFLPVLLAIYAITNGTGTLAGEEDNGTLEPILALPLPRWQIVITKALALGISFLIILLIVAGAIVVAFNSLPADVDTGGIESIDLLIGTLAVWPLIMFFATLSLFLGAYLPSRRIASTTATVIMIVSYFGNTLAGLVEALEKVQFLFAFHYFKSSELLTSGPVVRDVLTLLVASAAFLVLTLLSFERRNVTVSAWPWQRARIPNA
jgi:ABC-2 type transport system permease protein